MLFYFYYLLSTWKSKYTLYSYTLLAIAIYCNYANEDCLSQIRIVMVFNCLASRAHQCAHSFLTAPTLVVSRHYSAVLFSATIQQFQMIIFNDPKYGHPWPTTVGQRAERQKTLWIYLLWWPGWHSQGANCS